MIFVLEGAPAVEPVLPAELKTRLGLGSDVPDANAAAWIKAERQKMDGPSGRLGRALITQTWDVTMDTFPSGENMRFADRWFSRAPSRYHPDEIRLPLPPLQDVVSVKYLDAGGVEQTLDPSAYRVVGKDPAFLLPAGTPVWPATQAQGGSAVTIRIKVGYGNDGENVPEPIRSAIVLGAALQNSLTGMNLFVRSETIDGVGSTDFSGGTSGSATLVDQIERLVREYRVGGGIS